MAQIGTFWAIMLIIRPIYACKLLILGGVTRPLSCICEIAQDVVVEVGGFQAGIAYLGGLHEIVH